MKVLVTGGAGFIGSHVCDRLLGLGAEAHALDNLRLGRIANIEHVLATPGFRFVTADLLEKNAVRGLFDTERYDVVFHLAANSDIQRSTEETDLDLRLNLMTTQNVLDCARLAGTREIVFASSSTVYGLREKPMAEDSGPLLPVSLYGAGKLAAEAFLGAFAALFDMKVWIFRLPNVVGSRMTHGALHDFIRRLRHDPSRLVVLGDGSQRKPYVLVEEVIDAMLLAWERLRERVNCFNIGVESATSVRDIAQIVIEELGLGNIPVEYTGGASGWAGDVPRFEYDLTRIHRLGWRARHSSDEAVRLAARSQIEFTRASAPRREASS